MNWKLVYFESDANPVPRVVAEFANPSEGLEFGNRFAACDLVWGMTPEGHRFAQTPGISGSLQLRNPYYDCCMNIVFPQEAQ